MKILNINSGFFSSAVHTGLQSSLLNTGLDVFTYVPLRSDLPIVLGPNVYNNNRVLSSQCFGNFDRLIFTRKHKLIFDDIQEKFNINDYNFLHAHFLFDNGYTAFKLKEIYNIPYVVTVRNYDINFIIKWMFHLRKTGIKILEKADGIVFLSNAYKDFLIKKFVPKTQKEAILKKSIVLPSGIDQFWHNNSCTGKKLQDNQHINILHVGNINNNKNLLSTAKAIDILQQQGLKVNYTAVGNVVNYNILTKISKYVNFKHIKTQPKEELLKIYRQNDICVVPSIKESFGLVYPEAMSQGLPIIYSKGQGFDGLFENGFVGYSVQALNYNEIAIRIKDIINNYSVISKNCSDSLAVFDWQIIAEKYKAFYTSL
ncbi:MAG: glycosyltransferase family 4 protein [Candidatus Cloacimonadales bacterium]|jgi:glycosyltransferase involved in cell wall biosynthesis|nr:glycosyltransferase family 4 protein [Candidatus Cloacimonadota bacterium]MDD3500819.1 glycosyltransferase family 4 protein [Candidatus Cloacimonadota bacterium]MDX9978064.1 glycosyltransferase family 4 protein [Candidatus Cloacimonadales bacterium]